MPHTNADDLANSPSSSCKLQAMFGSDMQDLWDMGRALGYDDADIGHALNELLDREMRLIEGGTLDMCVTARMNGRVRADGLEVISADGSQVNGWWLDRRRG